MKRSANRNLSRRSFLARGAQGAAALGLARLSAPWARAAETKPARQPTTAYSEQLEALRKTDPKLIQFEQVGSFRSPRAEPKRIVWGLNHQCCLTAGRFLLVLDQDGSRLSELKLGDEVRCVAVAKDGLLYLGLREQVQVFDPKGQRLATWDAPGRKTWFTSLAVGDNDLFAADAGNRVVLRFDRSGKLRGRIGEKDPAKNIPGFIVPSPSFDLEIGSDGLLWVVNPGRLQLEAYTFDGALERAWGEASFGVAGFSGCCNPSYFTRLPDGRFVTSEKGLTRIKVYSAKGEFESVVAGPEQFPKYSENLNATPIALDVAVDASGRIYAADTLGGEIRIFKRKEKV